MRQGGRVRVRVLRVYDGDTLLVQRTGGDRKRLLLRLFGIGAPESDQEFGVESGDYLAELVLGGTFLLGIIESEDRYSRVVGILYDGTGTSINQQMVAAGWAYYWTQYGTLRGGQQAEATARRNGLGVWRNPDGGIRPWNWRLHN